MRDAPFVAKNGWLFHAQGSNSWLDVLTGKKAIPASTVLKWSASLSELSTFAPTNILVVPEKHSVVQPQLHDEMQVVPVADALLQALEEQGLTHSGFYESIIGGADGTLHIKTDTHMNGLGAYLQYICILHSFNLSNHACLVGREFEFKMKKKSGDLGSKLHPPMRSKHILVEVLSTNQESISNGVRNLGKVVYSRRKSAPVKAKLLIHGNSFSAGCLLSLLSQTFTEVLFIFFPKHDAKVIKQFKPDYILYQTNERFLLNPPQHYENISPKLIALLKIHKHFKVSVRNNQALAVHSVAFLPTRLFEAIHFRNVLAVIKLLKDAAQHCDIVELASITLFASSKLPQLNEYVAATFTQSQIRAGQLALENTQLSERLRHILHP